MFRKIVVPYDGSGPAENAVKHASGLVKSSTTRNCEITLVNIIPSIPSNPLVLDRPLRMKDGSTVLLSDYITQLHSEMQAHAKEALEKKKNDIEQELASDAKVRTVVAVGDSVADKIIELIEAEGADLVIIGNTGLSGISKLKALGSVSRAVSERSPCPVMIVR